LDERNWLHRSNELLLHLRKCLHHLLLINYRCLIHHIIKLCFIELNRLTFIIAGIARNRILFNCKSWICLIFCSLWCIIVIIWWFDIWLFCNWIDKINFNEHHIILFVNRFIHANVWQKSLIWWIPKWRRIRHAFLNIDLILFQS
jgi:hypothetical protein